MRKLISVCSMSPLAPMRWKGSVRAWRTRKKARPGPRKSSSPSSKPSMAYLVNITARAERDLAHLFKDINATDSAAARKWYLGLAAKILSLGRKPSRCPVTRENPHLRHLLFGRKPHVYRVIYSVIEKPKQVEVIKIHQGARK